MVVRASMRPGAVGSLDVDAAGVDPDHPGPMRSSTPRCSSALVALPDSWSPKVASGSLAPVHQDHPDR